MPATHCLTMAQEQRRRRFRADSPFLLSDEQIDRIKPHFPAIRGTPRVDDQRVVSGMIYVLANRLPWSAIPRTYGRHTTVYRRFVRWKRLGVLDRILSILLMDGTPDPVIGGAARNMDDRIPMDGRRRRMARNPAGGGEPLATAARADRDRTPDSPA